MKPHVLFILLFLFISPALFAQDLSDYDLVAHYTLIETTEDATGNYDTINLINAPYQGADGVYSYGGYVYDVIDEDSTLIQTDDMEVLLAERFAVQVEFKLDTLVPEKPIFTIGSTWRYLGANVDGDGQIRALFNNGYNDTSSETVNLDTWYTMTITHDSTGAGLSRYYLNDELVYETEGQLVRSETALEIQNYHGGNGATFRGNWRNLKIYGPGVNTSVSEVTAAQIRVSPNPSCGSVQITGTDLTGSQWILHDLQGRVLQQGILNTSEVQLSNLPDGAYVMRLITPKGQSISKMIQRHCR